MTHAAAKRPDFDDNLEPEMAKRVLTKALLRLAEKMQLSRRELCAILGSSLKKEGNRIKISKKPTLNGFLYFRCWLILEGKAVVEVALKDIEKLIDTDINIAEVKAEGLLYVTQRAFSDDDEDETIAKLAKKFDKKPKASIAY